MNKKTNLHQDNLLILSSMLSKLMKQRFGKGPENCHISLRSERLSVYVRNFITPAEEVLLGYNKINLVHHFRYTVMDKVFQEFAQTVSGLLHIPMDSFYSDWDYETNTGIMLLEQQDPSSNPARDIDFHMRERLFEHIIQVIAEVNKVPYLSGLIRLDQNLFAVECKGFMLNIDKVLYRKGCLDLLHERSREIKQSLTHHKESFGRIFGRAVEGLYMAWDFKNDRSYIFFYLKQ